MITLALALETRGLFTVITSCEEVLITSTESPVKKENLDLKEKLRIQSQAVEMDIISQ